MSHNRFLIPLAIIVLFGAQSRAAQKKEDAASKASWQQQKSGVDDDLHDVTFIDGSTGIAVGANQTILKTTNGGQTWRRITPRMTGGRYDLRAVTFRGPRDGWAISSVAATILHTADGGETWRTVPLPKESLSLKHSTAQAMAGANYLYLCWGLSGTHLYRTKDGGGSWEELNNQLNFGGVGDGDARLFFLDDQHGWYVNLRGTPGQGYAGITDDGGKTWREQELPTHRSMKLQFADQDHGWALPEAPPILATADGGRTWTAQDLGVQKPTHLLNLYFVSRKVGYVVHYGQASRNKPGYEVQHTVDGGKKWMPLGDFVETLGIPHAIYFNESGQGWVVGTKGYIGHYSNTP